MPEPDNWLPSSDNWLTESDNCLPESDNCAGNTVVVTGCRKQHLTFGSDCIR